MAEKKEEQAAKEKEEAKADREFTSGKGVTLTAEKNIPLNMCVSDASKIPSHLRRHPGGARVERGTTINVAKEVGDKLKSLGYATVLLALMLVMAAPAVAQTYTAGSTVTVYQECSQYYYEGSFTVDGVGVEYVTPELDMREAARTSTEIASSGNTTRTHVGNLAFAYAVSSEVGTETVDLDVQWSADGSAWTSTQEVQANFGTTAVTDTLNVVNGSWQQGASYARWLRLRFDPAGSTDGATITYRVIIPKRQGASCSASGAITSS